MMHFKDTRLQSILDIFEALGLRDDELEIIEAYLSGEAEKESLKNLSFRNLEYTNDEMKGRFCKIINSLLARKHYEDIGRIFEVLFQLGASTSALFFPASLFFHSTIRAELQVSPEKLVAVYAQILENNFWGYNRDNLKTLAEIGENDSSFILAATEHCKSSNANAKLLLLTVYLWKKYPNFQKEDSRIKVLDEDVKILTSLEDIILNSMDMIFLNHNSTALQRCAIQGAKKAIRDGELKQTHLKELKSAGVVVVSEFLFRLLGACSFINYMLSEKLRGVVSVFGLVDAQRALDLFVSMDCRDLVKTRAEDFDDIFYIAPEELIKWVSESKKNYQYLHSSEVGKNILKRQFKKNQKIFLEYQKKATIDANENFMEVMKDLVKNLHKGSKKRTLAWAYETPFSDVHDKKGELVSEEYLQAILLCYTGMSSAGISRDAKLLTEILNEAEFSVYVNELFDKWLEAGAEVKKRWVMYIGAIYGGSDMVRKLHHQIQEWPAHARGSIAADAVMALALSPNPQALLMVDAIARKFKFKQVKAAAGKALELAATELGLTREELEDKIVPDLGFDEQMERHFDYGERSFTVAITPALEIEVFDETGKRLKNLPAPGKKDEEEKAAAAYAEFKEMKKQMKTTISSQKMRLELALSAERFWKVDAWKELFVKNPVMHQFAIGLIWGIYEDHELKQTFRYMEDGSFNTEDEEEYTLPEQGKIALVHPIELSEQSKAAWKQQLEDYEIVQPIEQLNRPIYYRTEEEEKLNTLERFGGVILNSLSLHGKLQQLGWYRGSVADGGCFSTFYREDGSFDLGVELHFSGAFVGSYDGGEDVTIYDARFYKAGTIQRGSYRYDEVNEKNLIPLNKIPKRYFSEIVLQLGKVTASSQKKDENWKSEI